MIHPRDLLAIAADIARGLRAIAHDVDNRCRPPQLPTHYLDPGTYGDYQQHERGQR